MLKLELWTKSNALNFMTTLISLYYTRFDHLLNRTYMEAVSFSDLLVKLGFDERIFILSEIFSDNFIFSNYHKLIRIDLFCPFQSANSLGGG